MTVAPSFSLRGAADSALSIASEGGAGGAGVCANELADIASTPRTNSTVRFMR